jgi:zinc/manganese transport system substrate-binding protein
MPDPTRHIPRQGRRDDAHRGRLSQVIAILLAAAILLVLGILLFVPAPGAGSASGSGASGASAAKDSAGDSSSKRSAAHNGASHAGRPTVVVSVNQWQSVVSRVAGDTAEVTTILTNSGVDAHDFEPGASDQSRLAGADIVVVNGAGYDTWASKAAKGGPATIIDAASLTGVRDGSNPHVWFSQKARKAVARAVRDTLAARMPSQKKTVTKQYDAWLDDEKKLDAKINAVRKSLKSTSGQKTGQASDTYAATESVADYLATDLGLRDMTPTGYANAARNEAEPAPGDIAQFTRLLKNGSVRLLIVNTQEEDKTALLLEQAARSGDVPQIRLTETRPAKYRTTIAWISALVDQFSAALSAA